MQVPSGIGCRIAGLTALSGTVASALNPWVKVTEPVGGPLCAPEWCVPVPNLKVLLLCDVGAVKRYRAGWRDRERYEFACDLLYCGQVYKGWANTYPSTERLKSFPNWGEFTLAGVRTVS